MQINMNTNFLKKIKLPKIAQRHPIAFWVAIALHVIVLIGLLFSNVQRWDMNQLIVKPKSNHVVPKAVTIDLSEIKQEKQRLVNIQKKREKRLKDLQRAEKKVENERYIEQQRLKKLKVKIKKEKKAKAIAIKKRKVEEGKIKEALKKKEHADKKAREAEKKTKEAEKKKKTAEDNTRIAEKKKQEIEKQRKSETNKFKKEQNKRALTQEIQDETDRERKAVRQSQIEALRIGYINQIAARVKDHWRYKGAKDSWGCDVHILQDKQGNVKSVNIQSCVVDNQAKLKSFRDSIERAVNKASPLPSAPDEVVFDSEILFYFRKN